ncbi:hypothetical protein LEN26_020353 [Aphanomyces euteiches]|nr:hypothetical protein LEN26_020353 [Aphanomyces euteiches]KAH9129423.1 hypothetical protein AeMF1_000529 [Aphanomyces euteiches]KAH9196534.1 hypothetical protein AeNC1_001509 [Aphanomyces euteiches]
MHDWGGIMKRRRHIEASGVLQRECIEQIGVFVNSPTTFFSFLRALPHDVLGSPLQSLLTLSKTIDPSLLWPRLRLEQDLTDMQIMLVRDASILYPYVELSGMWDLKLLHRCLPPSTEIHLRNTPDDVDVDLPLGSWYQELTLFHVTRIRLCEYFGGFNIPGSCLTVLSNFSSLRHLQVLCVTALTALEQHLVFEALTTCPIESLSLHQSPWELSGSSVGHLTQWLESPRAMQLGLKHCNAPRPHTRTLIKSLVESTSLRELRFKYGNVGLALAHRASQLPPNLRELVLDECHLDSEAMVQLAKLLPSTSLHKLDVARNRIQDDGALALAEVLPKTQVEVLNIANADVGCRGVMGLALSLPFTCLQVLELAGNPMGDVAATALAAVLPRCSLLKRLDLSKTLLTDPGTVGIVASLPACRMLRSVDLSCNWMTFIGAEQAAGLLSRCTDLVELSVALNPIEERGVVVLLHALALCRRPLDLNLNVIMPETERQKCLAVARQLDVLKSVTLE